MRSFMLSTAAAWGLTAALGFLSGCHGGAAHSDRQGTSAAGTVARHGQLQVVHEFNDGPMPTENMSRALRAIRPAFPRRPSG